MSGKPLYLIGADIGGSHIGFGLVDCGTSTIVDEEQITIDGASLSAEDLVGKIVENTKELLRRQNLQLSQLQAVGMASPGQVKDNILVAAANLPRLVEVPLAAMVSKALGGIFAQIVNDADAAISAEVWGNPAAYSKYKHLAMVTLGTGVGFSIILNGQLHQGASGLIEGGHMIVDGSPDARLCGCGQRGCVEAYASAKSTVLRMQECDAEDNQKGTTSTSGKAVFDRYALNDFNAVKVVEETGEYLALLVINICRVVDPDVIIFGGGLSKAGTALLEVIKKHLKQRTWTVLPTDVKLLLAQKENSAGMLGAAFAARTALEHSRPATVKTAASASSPQPPPSISLPTPPPPKTENKNDSTFSWFMGPFLLISSCGLLITEFAISETQTAIQRSSQFFWLFLRQGMLMGQIGVGAWSTARALKWI